MNETHFDVVVIGSGFGGSVMTYRLAEAGLRGRLLEGGEVDAPGVLSPNPYRKRENVWGPI